MENDIVSLAYKIKDTAQPEIVRCLLPLCDTIVVSIYNIIFLLLEVCAVVFYLCFVFHQRDSLIRQAVCIA